MKQIKNLNALSPTEIRCELEVIDCELSPENLYCDGERSHADAMVIQKKLLEYQKRLLARI